MSQIPKIWGVLACMAALMAIFMFLLNIKGTREKAWQLIKSDFEAENAALKQENELLKHRFAVLKKQNMSLKKYLHAYENNFIALALNYWIVIARKNKTKKCKQIIIHVERR